MNPNILNGNLFGFIMYPAAFIKRHGEKWDTVRDIKKHHFDKHAGNRPLQFELPSAIGGTVFSSPYNLTEQLKHEQAAARLLSREHLDFLHAADAIAAHYTPQGGFTHLHGIGSWEDEVEPSMMTYFTRPMTAEQLKLIGADVGTHARQKAILTFAPHRGGLDKMLHMRVKTHHAMKQLSPSVIADVSAKISAMFNEYYDKGEHGSKIPVIPGRTILPDTTGHSDVLVGVGVDSPNSTRVQEIFKEISGKAGQVQDVQYWPGTTTFLGGHSPYSDEENMYERDKKQREDAIANYGRIKQSREGNVVNPEVMESIKMGMHSPARTGIVVRGVFYPPGKMIPNIEPVEAPQQPVEPPEPIQQPVKPLSARERILNTFKGTKVG